MVDGLQGHRRDLLRRGPGGPQRESDKGEAMEVMVASRTPSSRPLKGNREPGPIGMPFGAMGTGPDPARIDRQKIIFLPTGPK